MMTAFTEINSTETNTSRPTTRGGMRIGRPCSRHQASSTIPAKVQRVPEKKPGGTVAMPAFIASQFTPQTMQSVANSRRWRASFERVRRRWPSRRPNELENIVPTIGAFVQRPPIPFAHAGDDFPPAQRDVEALGWGIPVHDPERDAALPGGGEVARHRVHQRAADAAALRATQDVERADLGVERQVGLAPGTTRTEAQEFAAIPHEEHVPAGSDGLTPHARPRRRVEIVEHGLRHQAGVGLAPCLHVHRAERVGVGLRGQSGRHTAQRRR